MLEIIELIEQRRRGYELHPFIQFLRDERIPATRRLSYAPYVCHFVLTFGDVNRHYLSVGHGDDPVHQRATRHAEDDATHFALFLHDLGVLGFDRECRLSDALGFLWSDSSRLARDMSYYMISAARDASPPLRLVVIAALEAMGEVWLEATVTAARAHPLRDQLVYFGPHHLEREQGDAARSVDAVPHAVDLAPEDLARAIELVAGLFDRMEAFNTELLERVAAARPDSPPLLATRAPSLSQERGTPS